MTEPITASNSIFEEDISRLSGQLKERAGEGELTREQLSAHLAEQVFPGGAPSASLSSDDSQKPSDFQTKPAGLNPHSELKEKKDADYLDSVPENIGLIVNKLIAGLPELGLLKTVAKAKAESPFVLDTFHDSLTTRLYQELKERKLI